MLPRKSSKSTESSPKNDVLSDPNKCIKLIEIVSARHVLHANNKAFQAHICPIYIDTVDLGHQVLDHFQHTTIMGMLFWACKGPFGYCALGRRKSLLQFAEDSVVSATSPEELHNMINVLAEHHGNGDNDDNDDHFDRSDQR